MTFEASPARPGELTVLHWNIHSWFDAAKVHPTEGAVADLIRWRGPDVVSLNEVREAWGTSARIAELAEKLGYAWVFAPTLELGTDRAEGGYGNALLTRLPIRSVQTRRVTWPDSVYDGTEASEPRTLLLVGVEFGGDADRPGAGPRPVLIGTTHLPAGDAGARARAIEVVSGVAQQLEQPWLICGDFNTEPGWADSVPGLSAHTPGPTYPTGRPHLPIDYALAAPGARVRVTALESSASDHLPVEVRWEVPA